MTTPSSHTHTHTHTHTITITNPATLSHTHHRNYMHSTSISKPHPLLSKPHSPINDAKSLTQNYNRAPNPSRSPVSHSSLLKHKYTHYYVHNTPAATMTRLYIPHRTFNDSIHQENQLKPPKAAAVTKNHYMRAYRGHGGYA